MAQATRQLITPRFVATSLVTGRTARVFPLVAPSPSLRDLRKQAADEIEQLIAFLDASEPDRDLEEDDPPEDDPSGAGDYDGLREQYPHLFCHGERME